MNLKKNVIIYEMFYAWITSRSPIVPCSRTTSKTTIFKLLVRESFSFVDPASFTMVSSDFLDQFTTPWGESLLGIVTVAIEYFNSTLGISALN